MGQQYSSADRDADADADADGNALALAMAPMALYPLEQADVFLPEVVERVSNFLVGLELLQLGCVSRSFERALREADGAVWRHRLDGCADDSAAASTTYRERVFRARSLQFRGLPRVVVTRQRRFRLKKKEFVVDVGDCVELPYALLPRAGGVSFDMWFSILPARAEHDAVGGVLFGSQFEACSRVAMPDYYQHFVHVDPERNLYCSILASRPIVAHELAFSRWYHVALTFDGQRQSVFLDGQLVNTCAGGAIHKAHWLLHAQLGTGYLGTSSRGKPTPDFSGWCAFTGLIDEFRVWQTPLGAEDVRQLAEGRRIRRRADYKLTRDTLLDYDTQQLVACSRPLERQVLFYRSEHDETQ